jgi:hypothetical protein
MGLRFWQDGSQPLAHSAKTWLAPVHFCGGEEPGGGARVLEEPEEPEGGDWEGEDAGHSDLGMHPIVGPPEPTRTYPLAHLQPPVWRQYY